MSGLTAFVRMSPLRQQIQVATDPIHIGENRWADRRAGRDCDVLSHACAARPVFSGMEL
jgi:hypothetical protein